MALLRILLRTRQANQISSLVEMFTQDLNLQSMQLQLGKEGAISIHRFVQPNASLTIGRNRRDFIELNKDDIKVEHYDNASRQIPGRNESIDHKKSFRDASVCFTEEQVKAETARCLGCGASVVDTNKCIGCGLCTTKCEFDAIKLYRELPKASKMVKAEDKIKYVLEMVQNRKVKLMFKKTKTRLINRTKKRGFYARIRGRFSVIKMVEEIAKENDVTEISSVTVELGEVSSVIDHYLMDCWKWAIKSMKL